MKFTKMSLVAALLIGSSAFALENVKVSGNAKLFYNTSDATSTGVVAGTNADSTTPVTAAAPALRSDDSLFSSASSAGQAALGLGVTADLAKGVSAGTHFTALTTLGLQGQLVGNVWEGTNGTTDTYWFDQAWVAGTLGKTTVKVGRMELDTPLVFSENWSVAENTFESAVLLNQDIPDTTLVGAFVGGSNGSEGGKTALQGAGVGIANLIGAQNPNGESNFHTFYNGAYAVGAINNSWKPLTVQAWYFDATKVGQAYWLQADLAMNGVLAGAQATSTDLTDAYPTSNANSAVAVMVGYEMKDTVTAKLAYSSVDSQKGGLGTGANLAATGQSKLYTEAWWNYGYVTRNDTTAYNLTIESPVQGIFDLGLYYTGTATGSGASEVDMNELTLTASKKVGPLDATLAYVNTSADDQNKGDAYNSVQAYLTLNF